MNLRIIADWYFRPKRCESDALYRRLGLRVFLRYLPTGGTVQNRRFWMDIGLPVVCASADRLRQVEAESRHNEAIHLAGLAIMTSIIVASLHAHYWSGAALTSLLNLAVNLYPIMLQRWKRLRIYRCLERRPRRSAVS